MPAYQWKCHVCQSVNEAGTDTCTQCGFAANASGQQIQLAKRRAAGITDEDLGPYRTFWRRFFAMCIDTLIFYVPLTFLNWYMLEALTGSFLVALWMTFSTAIAYAYFILLHGKYGQTVGKRIMRIKIFDLSGKPILMRQAIRRDIVLVGLGVALLIVDLPLYLAGQIAYEAGQQSQLRILLTFAATIWMMLEFLTMLCNERRRSVNDFIAGTVVMRVDPQPVVTVSTNTMTA